MQAELQLCAKNTYHSVQFCKLLHTSVLCNVLDNPPSQREQGAAPWHMCWKIAAFAKLQCVHRLCTTGYCVNTMQLCNSPKFRAQVPHCSASRHWRHQCSFCCMSLWCPYMLITKAQAAGCNLRIFTCSVSTECSANATLCELISMHYMCQSDSHVLCGSLGV